MKKVLALITLLILLLCLSRCSGGDKQRFYGTYIFEKVSYNICNKDGDKTNWRLYASSDNLWIASYVDNTAIDSEIIMSIYKLSK